LDQPEIALAALTGKAPSWYRTGTAHYDDVAVQIVHELGLDPRRLLGLNADKRAPPHRRGKVGRCDHRGIARFDSCVGTQ